MQRLLSIASQLPEAETLSDASQSECELLRACASMGSKLSRKPREVTTAFDWPEFLDRCARHGLGPLAFKYLSENGVAVPTEIYAALWGNARAVTARNSAMLAELVSTSRLLDDVGIPSLPFKGPTLALAAYGQLGLREFGDLDVLLRPRHAVRASRVLVEHGYLPTPLLSDEVERRLANSTRHHQRTFIAPDGRTLIELHWMTDRSFPVEIDSDEWWDGLSRMLVEGYELRQFDAEDLILVTCIHASKHLWGSVSWLCDIAGLIQGHADLDWVRVMSRAEDLKAGRRVAATLELLRTSLDVDIPAPLQRWIASTQGAVRLAVEAGCDLFEGDRPVLHGLRRLKAELRLEETWRHRLRDVADSVLSPTLEELSMISHPGPISMVISPASIVRRARKLMRGDT